MTTTIDINNSLRLNNQPIRKRSQLLLQELRNKYETASFADFDWSSIDGVDERRKLNDEPPPLSLLSPVADLKRPRSVSGLSYQKQLKFPCGFKSFEDFDFQKFDEDHSIEEASGSSSSSSASFSSYDSLSDAEREYEVLTVKCSHGALSRNLRRNSFALSKIIFFCFFSFGFFKNFSAF